MRFVWGYDVNHRLKELLARTALATMLVAGAVVLPGAASAFVLGPTTNPGKWGTPGMGNPGGVVTWSLMPTGTSCSGEFAGCSITALAGFMPVGYLSVVQAAFGAWSAVANISFSQIGDDGAPFNAATGSGDIRLGGHVFDGGGGTLAHGFYPPLNGASAAGDIHFDIADTWVLTLPDAGIDLFNVLTHEIGHAIGLDHTGVANSLMNAFYSESFSGPQADDIAGAQFIYGAASVTEVPAPASALVFVFGLAGLGWARRQIRSN